MEKVLKLRFNVISKKKAWNGIMISRGSITGINNSVGWSYLENLGNVNTMNGMELGVKHEFHPNIYPKFRSAYFI